MKRETVLPVDDDELISPLTDDILLNEQMRADDRDNHNWLAKYIVSTDDDIPEPVREIARRVIEMHPEPFD